MLSVVSPVACQEHCQQQQFGKIGTIDSATASNTICENINITGVLTAAARVAAGLLRQLQATQYSQLS